MVSAVPDGAAAVPTTAASDGAVSAPSAFSAAAAEDIEGADEAEKADDQRNHSGENKHGQEDIPDVNIGRSGSADHVEMTAVFLKSFGQMKTTVLSFCFALERFGIGICTFNQFRCQS